MAGDALVRGRPDLSTYEGDETFADSEREVDAILIIVTGWRRSFQTLVEIQVGAYESSPCLSGFVLILA